MPAPENVALPIRAFPALQLRTAEDLERSFGEDGCYRVRTTDGASAKSITSCRALLELPLDEVVLEPDNDLTYRAFWSTAVDCVALQMLLSAREARQSRLTPLFSEADPTRLLPPSLGLSDFIYFRDKVQLAEARCQSWKAFDGSLELTARNDAGFSIRADIWTADVMFYARGDFDGDGYEDLIVRRDGRASEGRYSAAALLVLSRAEADACIRVVREIGQS